MDESLYKTNECRTWHASVADSQELLISTRVSKQARPELQQTLPLSGACAVQREVDVDVAVALERCSAQHCDDRVVTAKSRRLNDDLFIRATLYVEGVAEARMTVDETRHDS